MSNTINPNLPPKASTQSGEQVTPAAGGAADTPSDVDPEKLEAMKAELERQMKVAEQVEQQANLKTALTEVAMNSSLAAIKNRT